MTSPDYELIGGLAAAGLITQSFLTPRRCRRPGHLVSATITTAVRVIGGIHNHPADSRPDTHTALAASFTNFDVLMLFISNNSYSSHTFSINHSDFTAGQADLGIFLVFGNQLSTAAGRSNQLGTAARL
jgi:hypothetical protein